MAGIGFRLNKLLRSDDIYAKATGAMASIALATGPWLATIFCIAAISFIYPKGGDPVRHQIFRIIVNYTFAYSLISFAIVELVTTRYLADLIYLRQEKVIPTLYTRLAALMGMVGLGSGVLFYVVAGIEWPVALAGTILLFSITQIWCSMIFLSACKEYLSITIAFVAGSVLAVYFAYWFGSLTTNKLLGFLIGFTLGQSLIALSLAFRIFSEFGWGQLEPRDLLQNLSKTWMLIFVGFFYALCVWSDKIIFWFSSETGEYVRPLFYRSSAYDSAIFIAYISVVPAMAYFLVKMETDFYMKYRRYFGLIDNRAPLQIIDRERESLIATVRGTSTELIIFQGILTLGCVLFAAKIVSMVGLPLIYSTIYRYGLIASFLHVLIVFSNIIILYLDLPKVVAKNYFVFLALNVVFTLISIKFGYRFHGLGYCLAALIAFLVSVFSLRKALDNMNFHVFMKQPISQPSRVPLNMDRVSLK